MTQTLEENLLLLYATRGRHLAHLGVAEADRDAEAVLVEDGAVVVQRESGAGRALAQHAAHRAGVGLQAELRVDAVGQHQQIPAIGCRASTEPLRETTERE